MSNYRIIAMLMLVLGMSVPAAEDWAPLPRPDNWPFTVTTAPCPFWASPNFDHGYYASCKDRPIMTGDPQRGSVWQLEQLQRWLPGGVIAADIFADVNKPAAVGPFGAYMEAAKQVPGSRVFPLLDIVQPRTAPQEQREEATYQLWKLLLQTYGDSPHWFRVNDIPVITDYATGGLGVEAIARITQRLAKEGRKIYWISDAVGGLLYALDGANDRVRMEQAMRCVSGILQFGPPVSHARGGWAEQRKIFDALTSPRIFGVGVAPGYYSARSGMRNHVSARGTELLRRDLQWMVDLRADIVNTQTWNDYVEAAHFEPSYKHTSALLEIVRHYAEERQGAPHVEDTQPHLYLSYRKNIFAGEPLKLELLNLPVRKPFTKLVATVILINAEGKELARLPATLAGTKPEAVELVWPVPAEYRRQMLEIQVELTGSYRAQYRNLPPVPVISDGRYADPLTFTVPLHRLYTAATLRLRINAHAEATSLPMPRVLCVAAEGAPAIEGVSYLKSGAVINDPFPFSRQPVLENYPDDNLRNAPLPAEYYGALAQFTDGTIAYSNGLWCDLPGFERVHADYWFKDYAPSTSGYGPDQKDKLWDRAGHGYHGLLKKHGDAGAPPQWVSIGFSHHALRFDGKGSVVDLPGAMGFPIGAATVELLLKPTATNRAQAILCAGGELVNFYLEAGGKIRLRHANTRREFDDVVGTTKLPADRWTYVVGTYDMTMLRLYVNGELEGEVATDGIRPNEGARLGYRFWGGIDPRQGDWGYFQGDLARLRILQGASTPEQIRRDNDELRAVYSPQP